MSKRGQITVFIIIGLLVLVGFLLLSQKFFFNEELNGEADIKGL